MFTEAGAANTDFFKEDEVPQAIVAESGSFHPNLCLGIFDDCYDGIMFQMKPLIDQLESEMASEVSLHLPHISFDDLERKGILVGQSVNALLSAFNKKHKVEALLQFKRWLNGDFVFEHHPIGSPYLWLLLRVNPGGLGQNKGGSLHRISNWNGGLDAVQHNLVMQCVMRSHSCRKRTPLSKFAFIVNEALGVE